MEISIEIANQKGTNQNVCSAEFSTNQYKDNKSSKKSTVHHLEIMQNLLQISMKIIN